MQVTFIGHWFKGCQQVVHTTTSWNSADSTTRQRPLTPASAVPIKPAQPIVSHTLAQWPGLQHRLFPPPRTLEPVRTPPQGQHVVSQAANTCRNMTFLKAYVATALSTELKPRWIGLDFLFNLECSYNCHLISHACNPVLIRPTGFNCSYFQKKLHWESSAKTTPKVDIWFMWDFNKRV